MGNRLQFQSPANLCTLARTATISKNSIEFKELTLGIGLISEDRV